MSTLVLSNEGPKDAVPQRGQFDWAEVWLKAYRPWRELDLAVLCVAMLWAVLGSALEARHVSVGTILVLRISVVNAMLGLLCIAVWWACMSATQLLLADLPFSVATLATDIGLKVMTSTAVAALALLLRHPDRSLSVPLAQFSVTITLSLAVIRVVQLALSPWLESRLRGVRRVVVVGTGPRAMGIANDIYKNPHSQYQLLGFVDDHPLIDGDQVLGSLAELENLLASRVVDEVIIALPVKSKYDQIQNAIAACERVGVQSGYSMDFFSTQIAKRRSVEERDGSVVLHMVHNDGRRHLKRALDVFGAVAGLVLLSPVLLAVAIAVRATSKGPVIFRQQRYGLNRRLFSMYKFRSMVVDAEQQQARLEHLNEAGGPVFKIRHDPRITPIGRFIRKTSIDELPQLLNVLRGDMSLVGPRPLPARDVSRFSEPWLMRRFSVRPGLTGLWQVSGRSDTTFASWIDLDLKYIDAWSLLLDLRILAKTFSVVLKREGAA